MDKLELMRGIAKTTRPAGLDDVTITSLDQNLVDTGLDSLDLLMVGIYLGDIYGVSEEVMKSMQPLTVGDMVDFAIQHKTKEPVSLEAALESIQ